MEQDKPCKEIGVGGITAQIFLVGENRSCPNSYEVRFERSFMSLTDQQVRFNWLDLLLISKLADIAHTWIWEFCETQALAEEKSQVGVFDPNL